MTVMTKTTVAFGLVALALALSTGRMFAQSGHDLFQKALAAERADGNQKQAIQLYEQIVKQFEKTDRALVAKALIQLGQAYERLGSAQARNSYERVTRDFSDHPDAVNAARARLTALNAAPSLAPAHRQVWVLPPDVYASSVGYDGQHVSYVDWKTGDLFLRNLKSDSVRRLTTSGQIESVDNPQFAEEAALSRNNSQVAFGWYVRDRYELRLIDLQSPPAAEPRVLYRADDVVWIAPYDWSPDGTWIAVALSRSDRTQQVGILSVRDGSLKVLKSFEEWGGVTKLAISPDGRHVAFDAIEAGGFSRDVFVLAADGSQQLPVVVHKGDDVLVGWTPGGGGIVFASDRGGSPGLWLQEFTGKAHNRPPTLVKRDAGNARPAGMTRNGGLYSVAHSVRPSSVSVVTVDFTNGVLTSEPTEAMGEVPGIQAQPDWSSDGKQLAFVSRRARIGGRQRTILAVRAVDTGLTREYALELDNLYAPVFAPDGQRLVVTGYTRAGRQAASLIDLATGTQKPIAVAATGERLLGPSGAATAANWSGDGSRVYYRRMNASGFRLFEYEIATGAEREVISGTDPAGTATISPDGTKIYYRRLLGPSGRPMDMQEAAFIERDRATGSERELVRRLSLGAVNLSPDGRHLVTGSVDPSGKSRSMLMISVADGTSRELLQAARSGPINPIAPLGWAPDSRSILIRRAPAGSGTEEIWWAPVDGRTPRQLLTMKSIARTRIHPDGRRVVVSGADQPAPPEELWLLEGFLPKPRS
jgi:Tol biopolymer transport system component